MKAARGTLVVVGSLVFFALLAVLLRRGLVSQSADRFIVTVEAPAAEGRRLPLDRPLTVRVSGGRGAAAARPALALLLGGDGQLLGGPRPMAPRGYGGRQEWVAIFPMLVRAPVGGVVVAVAARPGADVSEEALRRLARAVAEAAQPGPGEAHAEVFGRILGAARAQGGHAEMIAAPVRPDP